MVLQQSYSLEYSQEDKDRNLDRLSQDAIVFVAAISRSYLGSRMPQLWPSSELGNIIIDVAMYALLDTSYFTHEAISPYYYYLQDVAFC